MTVFLYTVEINSPFSADIVLDPQQLPVAPFSKYAPFYQSESSHLELVLTGTSVASPTPANKQNGSEQSSCQPISALSQMGALKCDYLNYVTCDKINRSNRCLFHNRKRINKVVPARSVTPILISS